MRIESTFSETAINTAEKYRFYSRAKVFQKIDSNKNRKLVIIDFGLNFYKFSFMNSTNNSLFPKK